MNRERGIGNDEWRMVNRERGMGNRERGIGNDGRVVLRGGCFLIICACLCVTAPVCVQRTGRRRRVPAQATNQQSTIQEGGLKK